MNYKSQIVIPSQVIPGVSSTIRRMSDGRRTKFRALIAPDIQAIRLAQIETERIRGNGTKEELAALSPQDVVRLQKLTDDVEAASAGIDRAYLRACLVSVEGIEIDDKPATAESMIEDGPTDLYGETVNAIQKASKLSGKEEGEFGLPSISGELKDGQTNNTSVDTAESTPSTNSAIAVEPIPDTTA